MNISPDYISDTYKGLLHSSSSPLPSTGLKDIYDGAANKSSISISKNCQGVKICGELACDSLKIKNTLLVDSITAIKSKLHPIGRVVYLTTNDDPSTLFGGIWENIGKGKYIGGVGSYTDNNGASKTITVGNNSGGEFKHTMTDTELPTHTHEFSRKGVLMFPHQNETDNRTEQLQKGRPEDYSSLITSTVSSTGESIPHDRLIPSYGLNIWKRIA